MPKKKESAQEPATKADVLAVDQKVQALDQKVQTIDQKVQTLDQKVQAVDQKVQVLDQKVQAVDQKVNNIAIKVVMIESDLKEVKENMLTRADKDEIMNSIDGLAGEVRAMGRSVLIRGNWKEEHDGKLDNHEKRIQKLETSPI